MSQAWLEFWKILVGRCERSVVLARRRRVARDDRPSQHRDAEEYSHANLHRNRVQQRCIDKRV